MTDNDKIKGIAMVIINNHSELPTGYLSMNYENIAGFFPEINPLNIMRVYSTFIAYINKFHEAFDLFGITVDPDKQLIAYNGRTIYTFN